MDVTQRCIEAYEKHHHLKLAGQEVGIPWQTVYVHLKKAGVAVVGDKSRYGSAKDRLASRSEADFLRIIPYAEDQNRAAFQSKVDFLVGGYSIDVKSSSLNASVKGGPKCRWAFSVKKQEAVADFFVCFAYVDSEIRHLFLIPGEIARRYSSMSVTRTTKGKWWDYEVSEYDLARFFEDLTGTSAT